MKIAYLTRGNTPHDRRFLEKMVSRGHDVHFISYYADTPVDVAGVTLHHFQSDQVARFPRLRSLQIVRHLRKLLREIGPDILHSGWLPDHGFFGALSGFRPTLSMAWGSDVLVCPERSLSFALRIRLALSRADHIIANAQNVKARIIELSHCAPDKISLFPFGIELDLFHPTPKGAAIRQALGWEKREILISTRNLRPVYGIERLIDALPLVVKKRPQVGMILAGSGELEPALRRRAEDLGVADHVRFVGRLTPEKMADHLNAADLYVTMPSSDGTSSSLLEAMACGLPVIVSDIGPNREWVRNGEHGFLVKPEDRDGLAEKIVLLLSAPALRERMKKVNVSLAREKADWNHNFSVLEGIYTQLVAAHKN